MPRNKITFDDDDQLYGGSDSDNETSEREKQLLKKVKESRSKQKNKSSKQALFEFDESEEDDSEDDQNNFEMHDSDIDGNENDDDLPDAKAWGSKKRAFYSTDFVDQDYSTYNDAEEDMALQEEAEAKEIQLRLAKQLDEADFSLNAFIDTNKEDESEVDEGSVLKTDLSNMSKREKLQLFKKDSPEFEGLTNDFREYYELSEKFLQPFLKFISDNKSFSDHPLLKFVKLFNSLILTYCTNITFYLLLKSKRESIKIHPVVKRLVQLRQLILQLKDRYTDIIQPELEQILEALNAGEEIKLNPIMKKDVPQQKPAKKKLKILSAQQDSSSDDDEDDFIDENLVKNDKEIQMDIPESDSEEEQVEEDDEMGGEDDDDENRRGITYQMAKNKGLTPHRKKENRNPRVKYRNKYKKALTRRKGAVRKVYTETKRYTGEMSGIKSSVRKSIKIK